MSSSKPIGGYFELALSAPRGEFLHEGALRLSSGRSCFEYILRTYTIKKLYIPAYTCPVILEPLERLGIEYVAYQLNDLLELSETITLGADEYVMYNNYFGVKDMYCERMAEIYGDHLILDLCQSLYYKPANGQVLAFYSPRKFFGLPDGGLLYASASLVSSLQTSVSYDISGHLLRRIDEGPEAGYDKYQLHEKMLANRPMARMSPLTSALLEAIDFDDAKTKRRENFAYLHSHLSSENMLSIDLQATAVPLCYPYRTTDTRLRQKLIDARVYVPRYWPDIPSVLQDNGLTQRLVDEIIPLPIDQRYGLEDMQRILEVLHG